MNVVVSNSSPRLFRDRRDALIQPLVLGATAGAWLGSFWLMSRPGLIPDLLGALLCAYAMVIAAYLMHDAAHQALFAGRRANHCAGEALNFIAGSAYASFQRIMHLHIRHHVDRIDPICFDFKALLARHGALRATLQALEWAYIPAAEILMHLQVVARPFVVRSQRRHLPRVLLMLLLRLGLLAGLYALSPRAVLFYGVAVLLQLHVLNFFDAFHHTYDQRVVVPDEPVPLDRRDRAYEEANTYSNVISRTHPWFNALLLNFGYHNAHHHRPSLPWSRLPALHRQLYGDEPHALMPLRELLVAWHRHRVARVYAADYGAPRAAADGATLHRADGFVGAHGASFLTVV